MATETSINVIYGVPDDMCGRLVQDDPARPPRLIIEGTASFLHFMPPPADHVVSVWLGPGAGSSQIHFGPGPIINFVADPDRCGIVLERMVKIVDAVKRPCFNHPSAVLRSSRDQVAEVLRGIEKLDVPATIRVRPTEISDLNRAANDAGLTYPILARLAGDHGGVSTLKIDEPTRMMEVGQMAWGGRGVYLTEFRDFVSEDGLYRKHRLAVIGEDVFLRHVIIGEEWLLHAERRAPGASLVEEETHALKRFDAETFPLIRPTVLEMARRLKLDYLGIDCHVRPNGDIILFEANACMNIIMNTAASPNIWDEPISRISESIVALLGQPHTWWSSMNGLWEAAIA